MGELQQTGSYLVPTVDMLIHSHVGFLGYTQRTNIEHHRTIYFMVVSQNGATPKSSILMVFSL